MLKSFISAAGGAFLVLVSGTMASSEPNFSTGLTPNYQVAQGNVNTAAIEAAVFQKINQYRQSILNGRRNTQRGEHAPTDMIMDVMVPMTLRFIQDLKDTLPELTQPIITRIHSMLHDLHDRLSMFQMFADSTNGDVSCQCQCNSVGISCHACHQGAHEQCLCNCTE
jgi:hypothetical protein